ncbi:MAG: NAD(P)-binding protein [Acidimicrobiales bacterium]
MERPFAITLEVGSSRANKTGSWRTQRPIYVDKLPPCNDACPAGENIQGWLYRAEEGDYEGAWHLLMEDNPMPAVMGRVCYHNCETACNRSNLDEAVGINAVERFLGDRALAGDWRVEVGRPVTGRRVLVIGAGPSGMSAAYHLRRLGHEVTIYEASAVVGGMMRFGIPVYRLPRDVLDGEIRRIVDLGVAIEFNHKVSDLMVEMDAGGFDAVYLATGAEIARNAYVPAGDSARMLDALSLLRTAADMDSPQLGRSVVVYGGGNTAMDAARTAKRMGASDAIVVYRRTRDRMPAHDLEVEEALEEGIKMRWLSTIKKADAGELLLEKMELDETGFPQPTGEFEELEADCVVLAVGEEADLSLLENIPGLDMSSGIVQVDSTMMTSYPGLFAGGDIAQAERTVTAAIGNGKKAARNIDLWLRGSADRQPPAESAAVDMAAPDDSMGQVSSIGAGASSVRAPVDERHQIAAWDSLNTWYYSDAPMTLRPKLDMVRRQSTFDEVVLGLDEDNALFEARRCLSCGNCFECDNCYGVCPDNAVVKLSGPSRKYRNDISEPGTSSGKAVGRKRSWDYVEDENEARGVIRPVRSCEYLQDGLLSPGMRYEFDYDYCKGCGICAAECPCGAIAMVFEET